MLLHLPTTAPTHHPHNPHPRPQKSNTKYGNEHEAIAVYSMMRAVQKFCPIYTLCVGNAFGEAALLLAAGSKVRPGPRAARAARQRWQRVGLRAPASARGWRKSGRGREAFLTPGPAPPRAPPPPQGKRAALRSSTIMIRQPLQRLAGMQASDIDIYRRVTREKTMLMVGGACACVLVRGGA
jgi:ATP-dependent Clp protease protease subunit